jgi:hypothetical protein
MCEPQSIWHTILRMSLLWPPIYLHLIFDILQFEISSLMNWIFTACVACKNPVQTRKNPTFQTRKCQKSSADR